MVIYKLIVIVLLSVILQNNKKIGSFCLLMLAASCSFLCLRALRASCVIAVDSLRNPHRRKSGDLKSGDRGGQNPRVTEPSPRKSFIQSVVSFAVWAFAQSL